VTMHRATFVALTAAAAACPQYGRAQSDADPASSSAAPALRVLLGRGDAEPDPSGSGFLFNGRRFRGNFARLSDGSIVNVVDLEQYLCAVVPHEMPSAWPAAALAAQAVCARTYVLQRSDPRRDYDVVPSELDQVYGGISGESPAARNAVSATAGEVLRFGAGYAQVAYSSCCGGHTEASQDAWGAAYPYLGGVVCPNCTQSPNYHWTSDIALDDVAVRLGAQLPAGPLQGMRVAEVDASGRARTIELRSAGGGTLIKGSAFRLALGPRVLRSLLITDMRVEATAPIVTISGAGLGHGVGMCQWGARGLAQGGRNVRDILAFYFPGTQLGRD
jgi:stage II sporulation protein D